LGSINRRRLWHKDPISKITNTQKAGGIAQVIEHLLHTCKALSSTPSTAKKQKAL
jgi:hypothetical protein